MARPVMIEHRLDAFVFTDWHFVTVFCNQSALHTLCNMQRKGKEMFIGLCKKWRQNPAKSAFVTFSHLNRWQILLHASLAESELAAQCRQSDKGERQ